MDEQLHELENELKALRPRRPSVLLRARVERDLSSPAAAPAPGHPPAATAPRHTTAPLFRSWHWAGWQMAAAAAVVCAISVGLWRWQSAAVDPVAPDAAGTLARTSPAVSAPALPPSDTTDPRTLARGGDRMLAAATPDVYRPVKAANLLFELQEEGSVFLEDNLPGRRVRARYVDTYTWRNPATNASLKWSVPREEVRVVPTNYH